MPHPENRTLRNVSKKKHLKLSLQQKLFATFTIPDMPTQEHIFLIKNR
jgi:hypothetical protein